MQPVKPRSKVRPVNRDEAFLRLSAFLGLSDQMTGDAPPFDEGVSTFVARWQLYNMYRKDESLKVPGFNPRQSAEQEFRRCEGLCASTNERLALRFEPEGLPDPFRQRIAVARKIISSTLGPVPRLSDLVFLYGPGASFGVRGTTSFIEKLQCMEATLSMRPLLVELAETLPHLNWDNLKLVPGSALSFVPKTYKTNRPICIEPVLNGLVQKGIGSYIRSRLERKGVNLRRQSINSDLALTGRQRGLATVDLKSASDTIAFGLVSALLPFDWLELLDSARSQRYTPDKGVTWIPFEKFSSMGNAFTFELETLLFWALARACALDIPLQQNVNFAVYGDDIIVPEGCYEELGKLLAFCGFEVNWTKSFTGLHPFRESCGTDSYFGVNVTPFRLTDTVRSEVDVYIFANAFQAWYDRCGFFCINESDARRYHSWIVSHIRGRKLLGPRGFGDGHLHVNWDRARPTLHKPRGVLRHREGWVVWTNLFVGKRGAIPSVTAEILYAAMMSDPVSQEAIESRQTEDDRNIGCYSANREPLVFSEGVVLRAKGHWRLGRLVVPGWNDFSLPL